MASELRELYDDRPRRAPRHRRRARARGPAPPGRHPCGRGRDHARAAHRVPADPAQAARPGSAIEDVADRHAVRDARRRRPRAAQDGLPRPAQPRRHRDHARPRRARARARGPTSTTSPSTTPRRSRCCSGATPIGVFQLEGGPMRSLLRSLAPTTFEDVAALVALYRPGPDGAELAQRVRGPEERPQAGRLPARRPRGDPRAHVRADDLPGAADARRAAARRLLARRGRQPPQGDRQEEPRRSSRRSARSSSTAASRRATTAQFGERIFDTIEPFADYSFNKSHSVGYGYIAYQTAFLKANHPVEYLAALLTSVKSNKDQTAVFLNECRQLGIPVLVPDVNESEYDFSVRARPDEAAGAIRFGMSAVRNVGEGVVALDRRRARGGRAVHRLPRLLRARRPVGAEQAHDRVAGQGRRRSTRSAIRARAWSTCTSRSSTTRARRRREREPGHHRPLRRRRRVRRSTAVVASASTIPDERVRRSRSGSRSRRRCSAST